MLNEIRNVWICVLLIAVFGGFVNLGIVHAAPGVVPDLSLWAKPTWFKATATTKEWHFDNVGVKPDSTQQYWEERVFFKCRNWDSINQVLQCDVFGKDNNGNWDPIPLGTLDLNYIAGNDRDFMCWFHIQDMYIVFGATVRFTGVKNTSGTALKEATVSTMGTYFCEIDDAPSSTERWVYTKALIET